MPAAFIGHGSPMNALESNRYTESWRSLGAALPRPRAILVVSAHWYINATAVTAMTRPRTIHDFYGFPQDLFSVDYPAPGAPEVAAEVEEIAKPTWVGQDLDSWGLDHGTWSVLAHMFPDADIPVVQLAINAMKPFDHHLELGARLAPLRESGVLVMGSGNVVHNLGGMDPRHADEGFDWAHRFDDAARAAMTGTPDALPAIQDSRDFDAAVPTPDHFIPLLYLAGLGAAAGRGADVLVDGYAYGSLSMTAYTLGLPRPVDADGGGAAGTVPAGRPAEEMNI
ncbi:MAG: 4,5-DOPA dioxygenase extradiol [Pseudonocardia sp.]|nr:4,5-DOPA dioxygenase extradiol [Pseudonocardia sp.]